jgi:hypothetical protein
MQEENEIDTEQEGGFKKLFIPKIKNMYYGGDVTSTENNNNKNTEDLSETSVPNKTAIPSESEDNLIKLLKANNKKRVAPVSSSSYVPEVVQNTVKPIKNNIAPSSETSDGNNDLPDTEDLSSTSEENKKNKYYSETEGFYTTTIFEGESETKGVFNDIASGARKLFNYITKSLN